MYLCVEPLDWHVWFHPWFAGRKVILSLFPPPPPPLWKNIDKCCRSEENQHSFVRPGLSNTRRPRRKTSRGTQSLLPAAWTPLLCLLPNTAKLSAGQGEGNVAFPHAALGTAHGPDPAVCEWWPCPYNCQQSVCPAQHFPPIQSEWGCNKQTAGEGCSGISFP